MDKLYLKKVIGLICTGVLLTGTLTYLFFAQNSFTWLTHTSNLTTTYQMGTVNLTGGFEGVNFDVPLQFKASTQLRTATSANDSYFNDYILTMSLTVRNAGDVDLTLYSEVTPISGKANPGLMYYATRDTLALDANGNLNFAALLKSKVGGNSLNSAADVLSLLSRENAFLAQPAEGATPTATPIVLAPEQEINLSWAFWIDHEKALADTPSGTYSGKSALQESYDSRLYTVLSNDYGIHLQLYGLQEDYYEQ